ncbi:hypothetical protein HPB50_014491 [Hyalomma asiaticum]|uniref:Uncharacterized protein n=1 Tax=Hyalomma asiaticum TaxID=266040 RepID=A0ACB7SJQ9_HYAAI|nr:hypothetical protein HPB50_014491 [Hyalomma asiaticum]
MDVISVEGESISREEHENDIGWNVVRRKAKSNAQDHAAGDTHSQRHHNEGGSGDGRSKGKQIKKLLAASRMPRLPKEDLKVIVRPRGGFNVADYGINRLECCVANAAGIPRKDSEEDTVCANYKQNILVISTPPEKRAETYRAITKLRIGDREFEASAYETAPEDTSKGVIKGITDDVTPKEIVEMLVTPRNPTVLMAKRMGNTTNVTVLFDGHYVPRYVY